MSNYSPVCNSVNKIIDLFDINEKVEVCSYKDEGRFKELWDFHHIENDSGPPTILVVWDGIPSGKTGSVDTSKYLTPIDWAVGYSLSIANKEKDPNLYPDLRIFILDVDSQSVSDSDSLKFVHQSSNMNIMSMPWIRTFSMNATDSGRDIGAFFRNLVRLGFNSTESTDLDSEGFKYTNKPVVENEEDKTSTVPLPEICTPSSERPFLRQKIDAIDTNIRTLVNMLRDSSKSTEKSPDKDDIVNRYLALKESFIYRKPRETAHALYNFFRGLVNSEGLEPANKPLKKDDTSTFSPLDKETVCGKTPDYQWNTETRDETFLSMKNAFENKTRDLGIIRNIWAAFLTRPSTPGDSHAIANLVGPLLLMKEAGNLHVNALQSLMECLGLLPDNKEATSKKDDENAKAMLDVNKPWLLWNPPVVGSKRLKLILIDDMFESGWGRMLCLAMGVKYQEEPSGEHTKGFVEISKPEDRGKDEQIVIKATSSAEWILVELDKQAGTDKRFEFTLDGSTGMEILFLDLRLYPGDFNAETKFFEKLIEIAKKFTEGSNKNLSWDGFTNDEIESIEEWLPNCKQEDPVYIKALTLLPRILSLTDLSLPIILFSSTGRRDITEQLKPYGNIITVLEKPRFTVDIPVDIALQTRNKFRDAMGKTLSILRAREICRKVRKLAHEVEDSPAMIPAGTGVTKCKHIEIYIDESGEATDKDFSVGGLIMAYPEYDTVNTLSEELKKAGYYWYSEDEKDRDHLSKRPNKQNENRQGRCAIIDWTYEDAREKFINLCKQNQIFVSAICVPDNTGPTNNSKERHVLLKDIQGDERYKRLLSALLELAIYEYIPALIDENSKVTLSVFPATRTVPLNKDDLFEKHTPDDYFGYGYKSDNAKYYTISFNSIHPIVASILRSRVDMHKELTLHHARGVYLQYGVPCKISGNDRNKPLFYQDGRSREMYYVRRQHYFADHVLKPGGINEIYKEEFETGFVTELIEVDGDRHTLRDFRREILNGNIEWGVVLASKCNSANIKDKMHGHLIRKIGESLNLDHFDGSHFMDIFDYADEEDADVGYFSWPEDSEIEKTSKPTTTKEINKVVIVEPEVVKDEIGDKSKDTVETQAPEKAVATEGMAPEITVRVVQVKKTNNKIDHYRCDEVGGTGRKIRIKQKQKQDSGIESISVGDILQILSTYKLQQNLYAREIRKTKDSG